MTDEQQPPIEPTPPTPPAIPNPYGSAPPYQAPGAGPSLSKTPDDSTPPTAPNPYGAAPYGATPYGSAPPTTPNSYAAAPYGGSPEPSYNVLAIVSLVTAFFVSLAAVITGHIALVQIKRTGQKGRGLAVAGLVLGYLGILGGILAAVFIVIAIVAAASNPNRYGTGSSDPFSAPTAAPTASSGPGGSGFNGGDLTFEAGQSLPATTIPQFADGFITSTGWSVSSPDDGQGNWSYTSSDKQCTVKFHQGLLGSKVTTVPGDDQATTDAYLIYVDNATASDVDQYAETDYVGLGSADASYSVDTRTLTGTDSNGSHWITAARAFASTGTGMYLDLTCQPATDLTSIYYDVLAKAAIVVN
ncbi:DUF4190 domain-containing protein [Subtercola vilae]|nr:DUF4190 domain-containing protein [Subtercola vilae]